MGLLQKIRKMLTGEQGFTLIELIIVVIILSILVAIATPRFISKKAEAEAVKTQADLTIIQNAVDFYFLDHSHYPDNTEQLVEDGHLKDDPYTVDGGRYQIDPVTGEVSE